MRPKTDDKGVRRAEFSAADVKLWRSFSDSLTTVRIIEEASGHHCDLLELRDDVEKILLAHTPPAEPEAPDGG